MKRIPSLPLYTFASLVLRHLAMRPSQKDYVLSEHQQAAIDWLIRAQNMSADDGVCHSFSLKGGWRNSYIETTGYIIETFYDLAKKRGDADFAERAERMARWLTEVQLPDGSFPNQDMNSSRGIVFDTGQDLFGMVRAFKETQNQLFFDAAFNAGQWLSSIADENGVWTKSTYRDVPHVYNTRTAWALLELNAIAKNSHFESIARANLDWALEQQNDEGWFDNCAFEVGLSPFTHTIAYATRGLLESGRLLGDENYKQSAIRAALAVGRRVRPNGFLAGQIDIDGKETDTYCCLTGNCQFAIIWAKIYADSKDMCYLDFTQRALNFVMSSQHMDTHDLNVRGAISGSFPIWGKYHMLQYPNWAAKFFIEATLLLEDMN